MFFFTFLLRLYLKHIGTQQNPRIIVIINSYIVYCVTFYRNEYKNNTSSSCSCCSIWHRSSRWLSLYCYSSSSPEHDRRQHDSRWRQHDSRWRQHDRHVTTTNTIIG